MSAAERDRCGTCHVEHGGKEARLIDWPGGKRQTFDHLTTGFALAGKHADLRCEDCHKPEFVQAADVRASKALDLATTHLGLSTRCADCHRDPHRGQFSAGNDPADCSRCHSAEGWSPARFDHNQARFVLDGRHSSLACARCHFAVDAKGAKVASHSPGATVRWRPIESSSCAACHVDPHQQRFGNDCARCHTTSGWDRVAATGFDHSRTRYPLTGRHKQVECARCHRSENAAGQRVAAGTAGAKVRYRPVAFAACTDCHNDPHRERLGRDCARCHTTTGWDRITSGAFDHARTAYPLAGQHAALACAKCHRSGVPLAPLAHAACVDCHADAHAGRLASRADRGACESCHSVDGFAPARFGPAEHAATRFELQGAHRAIACVVCHDPAQRRVRPSRIQAKPPSQALAVATSPFEFRVESRACSACHADPHAGQFAAQPNGGKGTDCARCHVSSSWRLPGFDHSKTRFHLDGAHQHVACAACHRQESIAGSSVIRYRPLETACRACHLDPVRSQGK